MGDAERCPGGGGPVRADPVLRQRARIMRYVRIGRCAGYVFYSLALAVFGVSRAAGFDHSGLTAGAVVGLIAGTVILGPAIIVGYAVKAADLADREGGW